MTSLHPHVLPLTYTTPKVTDIRQSLKSIDELDRRAALAKAKELADFAEIVKEAFPRRSDEVRPPSPPATRSTIAS